MPATKAYTRVSFENYPSTNTPLNATNLNKVDKGIDDLDDLLVTARNNIETLQSNATTDEEDISDIQSQLTASNQTAGVSDVPFRFGCTDDGKFGYILTQGGADSVIPFKSTQVFYLGNYVSNFNVASLFPNDYQNFTSANFILMPTNIKVYGNAWGANVGSYTNNGSIAVNYNAQTGRLNLSRTSISYGNTGLSATAEIYDIKVYLVVGDIETP